MDPATTSKINCSCFHYLTVTIPLGDSTHFSFWCWDCCFWQTRVLEGIVWEENIFSPVNSTEGGWNLYIKEDEGAATLNLGKDLQMVEWRLMVGDLGTLDVGCRSAVLSAVALQLRIPTKKRAVWVSVLVALTISLDSTNNTKDVAELKRTIICCKNKQNHQDVKQLHSFHTVPQVRKKIMIIFFGAVKLFTPLTFHHGCISLAMVWGCLSNTYNLCRSFFWIKCRWPIHLGLNPPFPSTSSFVFKGYSCHSAKAELIT